MALRPGGAEKDGEGDATFKTYAGNCPGGSRDACIACFCPCVKPDVVACDHIESNVDSFADDESNMLSFPSDPPTPAKTSWTLLVYLTGPATGCMGGETVFYPELGQATKSSSKHNKGAEPVVVGLEVGMALLHKHGQDCLLHEGRRVTKGEKWVIRSDLCVRR